MQQFENPAEFAEALRAVAAEVLPAARVVVVRRTMIACKMRVELGARRFIDVFFNARNQRMDLSLIEGDRRSFGYDNLGAWHRHPTERPDRHEACDPPTLEQFFREVAAIERSRR